MSDVITIKGRIRQQTGKGVARKLRATGWIPANLIGKETGSKMLELEAKDLSKAWQKDRQFNLDLEGEGQKLVKIQELQLHAAKRRALHVDLMYL